MLVLGLHFTAFKTIGRVLNSGLVQRAVVCVRVNSYYAHTLLFMVENQQFVRSNKQFS